MRGEGFGVGATGGRNGGDFYPSGESTCLGGF